ncbi:hypothetical protein CIG75_19240 [Tumebacillus algifaecis]|uniref:Uncharacterized protein n=1 Tax=Tumebacillus algifaecis TaxID=1214604 RepID=A0A223D5I5_9BACL|nr:hypothetical protein [Tumebacillus algifaecis]ASS76869.1 hypothetical protein CIG75_19240 [Tumebacillus algifaecis]
MANTIALQKEMETAKAALESIAQSALGINSNARLFARHGEEMHLHYAERIHEQVGKELAVLRRAYERKKAYDEAYTAACRSAYQVGYDTGHEVGMKERGGFHLTVTEVTLHVGSR